MSVMKQRDVYGGSNKPARLSEQGSRSTGENRAGGNRFSKKIVDGLFDGFYPREKSVWIHVTPHQSWDQWAWDRDLRESVHVNKTWYQYRRHYCAPMRRSIICSAGPTRSEPCYGCAIRNAHYRKMDAIEERTGVRPKDEPPIGGQDQFGFSIVVMENILTLPKRNPDGSPKLTQGGKPIYEYVPESLVGNVANAPKSFGKRFHMSLSKTQHEQLLKFDEEMRNYCANCASELSARAVICPDCETAYDLPETVKGEALSEEREKTYHCECGYNGPMQPQISCGGCGNAEEGRLTDFDIRLKREKLGPTSSVLKIPSGGVRKTLSTVSSAEGRASLQALIESPLNLLEIYAPTPVEEQQKILKDLCHGVDPRPNRKNEHGASPDVEGYQDDSSDVPY